MTEEDEILERLEKYMQIASLRCPCCDELGMMQTPEGEIITPEDFGIHSLEEWETAMSEEWEWIEENEQEVRSVLLATHERWPNLSKVILNRLRE